MAVQPRQRPRPIVASLAAELVDDLPAMTDRLVELIKATDADYAGLDLEDLTHKVWENLHSSLSDLAAERPVSTASARETARRRADQGVPLASVLHAFRLGFTVMWDAMVDRAPSHSPEGLRDLVGAASTVWAVVDTHSDVVTAEYREALIDLGRRDEQRRTLVLDALLEGRPGDWSMLNGSLRALGLPDHGPYVVVSAEAVGASAEPLPQAEQVLRRGGVQSAWRQRAGEQVGLVAAGARSPAPPVSALLGSIATGRVGLSPEYDDAMDTARALPLATIARRSLPRGAVGVATLDDHPIAALAAASPEIAARVARLVLGGVVDADAGERGLLLTTLEAWLAAAGNATEAGRRLYCHRNTVRNRLRRLEQLSGRSLDDPR
ncbi:MAG: PucR family transcriptional regulator, partial [Acidimicrobiales bacterium]